MKFVKSSLRSFWLGLGPHHIDVELKEVDRNSSIAAADAIDKEILGDSYGGELPPVKSEESKENDNGEELLPVLKKNNKVSQMHFISTWDLVRATMNGKFCGGLRNYASLMITLNRIFLEESKLAIDRYAKTSFKEIR